MHTTSTHVTGLIAYLLVGAVFITIISDSAIAASSTNRMNEELNVIANFADRICGDIPLTGGRETLMISGSANAELNGLIKKLANLGIEGAVKYEKSEYQNVLREDLAAVLATSTQCKLDIVHALKDKILNKGPEEDDPVYVALAEGLRFVEQSFRETNPPADIAKQIKEIYLVGALVRAVVRFGKDYKSYITPTEALGGQWLVRPSAVYNDKQGRKYRTVTTEYRRMPGGGWDTPTKTTFIWIEGDWKELSYK